MMLTGTTTLGQSELWSYGNEVTPHSSNLIEVEPHH